MDLRGCRPLIPLGEVCCDHIVDGAVVSKGPFARDGEGFQGEELDVFLEGGFDDPSDTARDPEGLQVSSVEADLLPNERGTPMRVLDCKEGGDP